MEKTEEQSKIKKRDIKLKEKQKEEQVQQPIGKQKIIKLDKKQQEEKTENKKDVFERVSRRKNSNLQEENQPTNIKTLLQQENMGVTTSTKKVIKLEKRSV